MAVVRVKTTGTGTPVCKDGSYSRWLMSKMRLNLHPKELNRGWSQYWFKLLSQLILFFNKHTIINLKAVDNCLSIK